MSEPKFTPGPWKVDRDVWLNAKKAGDVEWVHWLVSAMITPDRPVSPDDGDSAHGAVARCDTEANAHLIAAAPEMHRALAWMVKEMADDSHLRRFPAIWAAAREALAKAEGA